MGAGSAQISISCSRWQPLGPFKCVAGSGVANRCPQLHWPPRPTISDGTKSSSGASCVLASGLRASRLPAPCTRAVATALHHRPTSDRCPLRPCRRAPPPQAAVLSTVFPAAGSVAAPGRHKCCLPLPSQGAAAADFCGREVISCCRLRRRRPFSSNVSAAVASDSQHSCAPLAPGLRPLIAASPPPGTTAAGCVGVRRRPRGRLPRCRPTLPKLCAVALAGSSSC